MKTSTNLLHFFIPRSRLGNSLFDHLRTLTIVLTLLLLVSSCKQQQSDSNSFIKSSQIFMPTTNAAPTASSVSLSNNPPPASDFTLVPLDHSKIELENSLKLVDAGNYAGALDEVNGVIQANPQNKSAYSVRGNIYTKMKDWENAKKDFDTILQLDSGNSAAKFNLYELKFMQKDYGPAREGFASLENDPDLGDLASYKAFLSDLFSGQDALARRELDGFDQTSNRPSYYFGNAAWSLYHQRPDDARSWLDSAVHIYAPKKVYLYTFSLQELGYLPLQQK